MYDLIYLTLTVAFFGLMLGYVVGCARIGRGAEQAVDEAHGSHPGRVAQ